MKGPTPRQRDALRDKKAHGDTLRSWLQSQLAARQKARAEAKKKRVKKGPSRGVDRVPKRLRGLGVHPEILVEHMGPNYRERRRWAKNMGRNLAPSVNQPYVNPERDLKRHARLRKDTTMPG